LTDLLAVQPEHGPTDNPAAQVAIGRAELEIVRAAITEHALALPVAETDTLRVSLTLVNGEQSIAGTTILVKASASLP
jgi:hypothetical protein